MHNIFRALLVLAFTLLFLESCSLPSTAGTPVLPTPTLTSTHLPPTITLVQSAATATATRIPLPVVRGNVESVYCQSPSIPLPLADAQGLNEDEIVGKLMELWLEYFNAPQAPDYCRVDEYYIERVYYDEYYSNLPLEPKGDFMRQVLYSVKLIQTPSFWISMPGVIDQQNWLHTGANVAVFRSDSGYTMKFAHP